MIDTAVHIDSLKLATNAFKKVDRYDPTRTTTLRNAFARDIKKRFDELAKVITRAIVDQDCFGLAPKVKVNQMEAPMRNAFDFPRSSEKVAAFMKWLQRQIDRGLLEVGSLGQVGEGVEEAWTDKYILDSYKRGVQRARYEMKNAGMDVPSLEATGGITMSMFTPFHLDRVGLLYSRVFSELRGITNAMDTQISRILSQGMADGDNPRLLARKLVTTINGVGANDLGLDVTYINKSGKQVSYFMPAKRRAEILARTEIIRAHHQATIQEYRNWGLLDIKVRGEWRTTNDDRVCERCAELEGHVFSLDEIEGMIPLHPQCRCVALPYIEPKSGGKKND